MLEIYCTNLNEYLPVEGGETLQAVANRLESRLGFRPICARVNNKTEGLCFAVYAPKQVEFLESTSPTGVRVYTRSLCMLLYKAVAECLPDTRLRIEHSVSRGYYCTLTGHNPVTADTVKTLRNHMHALADRDLPLERHERLSVDVKELFRRQGLDDKVLLLESLHTLYTDYYTLDGLADSYYGRLAPSTGYLKTFDLQPYKDGMLLLSIKDSTPLEAETPTVQEKMFHAFTDYVEFNRIVGIRNVGELNRAVTRGESANVVNVSEALHNQRIARIAETVAERNRRGGARIVLIAGPSSSGKTTFTKRLAIQLITNLLKPVMISLDDYFVDREKTPLDIDGERDYESLYALDLEAFNRDIKALLDGREISLPRYNFARGEREYRGETLRLEDDNVLLIEGIHGLNPELTSHIADEMKFRIYISALTTISIDDHNWIPTTDNRLMRRIIRDHKYRGASAIDTIRRWPSVRRGEEKWIYPYQENADVMFNSSLLYELGVMKHRGEEILSDVPHDCPEYAEASRLHKFLSFFTPIDDHHIPSTSLLREFLGGSSFKY